MKNNKEIYIVTQFYSDTLPNTEGTKVKEWTDPRGNNWIKLFFGRNLSGQKLQKSFPKDVLKLKTQK